LGCKQEKIGLKLGRNKSQMKYPFFLCAYERGRERRRNSEKIGEQKTQKTQVDETGLTEVGASD
jgi:hypothetical protein